MRSCAINIPWTLLYVCDYFLGVILSLHSAHNLVGAQIRSAQIKREDLDLLNRMIRIELEIYWIGQTWDGRSEIAH